MRITPTVGRSLALTALVVALAVGCGEDEPRTGGVDASGVATPEGRPSAEDETAAGSSEPAEPPEPSGSSASEGYPPADGPTLSTTNGASLRVPRGFDDGQEERLDTVLTSERASDMSSITLSSRSIIGEADFELFKQIALESTPEAISLRVLPDRELLGQPAYHFAGSWNRYQRVDQFGVEVPEAGIVASVQFVLLKTLTPAQRAQIIEPVLASLSAE